MAFQDSNRPMRQMFDVTALALTCSECGTAINELPFEPTKKDDGTYGKLYCYQCNKNRVRDRGPRTGGGFGGGRRF